ncbi:MAG: TolC family protein [Colwellia sp.]
MLQKKENSKVLFKCGVSLLTFLCFAVVANEMPMSSVDKPLSLEKAITLAQINDPWLTGNFHRQRAMESMSMAVSTLPDPKITLGLANLPTDGFDFGQEGMTQAKIGISQMFPRGDTLEIKSQQLRIQSEAFPYQREDRKAKVAVIVGSLWLDAFRVQQSIALIKKNRSLFGQLVDVAEASYSSALGRTRQQDIVRAQLELTRLEDRLDRLAQQKNSYAGLLSQWLTTFSTESKSSQRLDFLMNFSAHNIVLSPQIPQIELLNANFIYQKHWLKSAELVHYFTRHPAVIAVDKKVSAIKTGIKLAQQKYKPEWSVSASYGYRGDDPMDNSRADLFSAGITFDLPIFTNNRQDKEVQSAISQSEAVKTEKLLLLRQLLGSFSSAKGRLLRLNDRQNRYKTKLLPQIHDQAEASLTAYTHDDGDFSEVVRARIAVLNAEIDELTIDVEEQKILLELNYLFLRSMSDNSKAAKRINKLNFASSGQYVAISGER